MNILYVSHYYPPHVGGLEVVAKRQAESSLKHGNTVTVVTSATDGQPRGRTNENGVIVHRGGAFNIFDRRFGIPFPIPGLGFAVRLSREVHRADIVHLHDVFYFPSWIAAVMATICRKPIILTQHVGMVEHNNRAVMFIQKCVYRTIGRFIFARARTIIVYNTNVRSFLLAHGVPCTKIVELRNGIDLSLFKRSSGETRSAILDSYGVPSDKPIILFVGRFVPKKGFDVLYEARSTEYNIVFAGTGYVPDEWRRQRGVYFIGPLAHEKLAPLYRSADVFVFPAVGEIFTLVMQEAMASGLPVVTTNDPGYRFYDVDRDLIAFVPPDPPSLSKAIRSILSDEKRMENMRAYSLSLAEKWFNWDENILPVLLMYGRLSAK